MCRTHKSTRKKRNFFNQIEWQVAIKYEKKTRKSKWWNRCACAFQSSKTINFFFAFFLLLLFAIGPFVFIYLIFFLLLLHEIKLIFFDDLKAKMIYTFYGRPGLYHSFNQFFLPKLLSFVFHFVCFKLAKKFSLWNRH